MIIAALLLQASVPQATAESRRLYEPYRQCLSGQVAQLAGPDGEASGLDRARTNCMAQNLSAGTNALFAEMRMGLSQDEAGERVAALRVEIEQEAVARARAQPGPAQESLAPATRQAVSMARVAIPDEIAPAILPYMRCLMGSRGVPMRRPGGAADQPAAAVGADCAPVRQEAARRADAMLVAQHRGTAEQRRAFVERALAGVDTFAARSAGPPPNPEEEPHAED